jgi:ribosomal 30S subunit maturation factor RimM
MVEALELESSWVETYGVSGELNIPSSSNDQEDLVEPLRELKEVAIFISYRG